MLLEILPVNSPAEPSSQASLAASSGLRLNWPAGSSDGNGQLDQSVSLSCPLGREVLAASSRCSPQKYPTELMKPKPGSSS